MRGHPLAAVRCTNGRRCAIARADTAAERCTESYVYLRIVYLFHGNHRRHTEINSTVSALSDDQLLEQAGKLAGLDHQIHVFVIDHLLEIEARRVYLSRGFSSLFDYVKRGLGYSDAATWRRINAMKLCTRIDGVRERLWDGSLTLDAAAQLQAAFERRDRERGAWGRGRDIGYGANGSARPYQSRDRCWTYRRRRRWWSKRPARARGR